jgi:uncharacterized membrane protein (DUF106 family)
MNGWCFSSAFSFFLLTKTTAVIVFVASPSHWNTAGFKFVYGQLFWMIVCSMAISTATNTFCWSSIVVIQ